MASSTTFMAARGSGAANYCLDDVALAGLKYRLREFPTPHIVAAVPQHALHEFSSFPIEQV